MFQISLSISRIQYKFFIPDIRGLFLKNDGTVETSGVPLAGEVGLNTHPFFHYMIMHTGVAFCKCFYSGTSE